MPGMRKRECSIAAIACLLAAASPGTIVRFDTVAGSFNVRLLESAAPATVSNFLGYVTRNDYANVCIHRSAPGFVIQGGRYRFDGSSQIEPAAYPQVPQQAAVTNEPAVSNVRGTLALAKVSGNPNSGTREWFINLANNSTNLDAQNGGFTVFGRVLGSGMAVPDSIAALPVFAFASPWSTAPMRNYTVTNYATFTPVGASNVVYLSISVTNERPGDFNFDGQVDLSDLCLAHATLGSVTAAEADGNGSGSVDAADLDVWADHADAGAAALIRASGFLLPVQETSGAIRVSFTNAPGLCLSVHVLTDLADGAAAWTRLGDVQEISPGSYRFVDTAATNATARYYRVGP